jgi:hypothetical protein
MGREEARIPRGEVECPAGPATENGTDMLGGYHVRIDPWEPEYEAAIQLGASEEQEAEVDLQVELGSWVAVQPSAVTPAAPLFFVDGVRRIEHRILVEAGDRTLFGLLGSFAVGATRVAAQARVLREEIRRTCVVGGGVELAPWEIRLPNRGTALRFEAAAVAENTPEAALQGLQNSMREREAALAESLSADDTLVFLDGPLTFFTATKIPVVGYVKRLLRSYLPPQPALLLRTLEVGQRTPLFLIKDTRHHRYSWYTRIGSGRMIESSLTGIVRLETSSAIGLEQVRSLADLSAALLPRFASSAGRDPRAPQNLYPIGGLENALRHKMGDTLVIRRAIEAHLHGLERSL